LSFDGSDHVKEYKDLFIEVQSWQSFDEDDLDHNWVEEDNWCPEFIDTFRAMLDKKRVVRSDVRLFFYHLKG
jgi:hypothetical protein